MKHLLIILCLFCSFGINAQQRFVKAISDAGYGTQLRIVPTPDNGWVVLSMDSLKLTKFSPCGTIEWSKNHDVPNCFYHADFIATANGFALLSRQATDGSTKGALITTMDAMGNITASKNVVLSQCDLVPYSLFTDSQGNFIVYANATEGPNTTYSVLCKVNLAGTVLWTQFYDMGVIWGKALATSDQGYLLRSGCRFIKTDASGNVQWTTRVDIFSMSYYAAVEMSDGYIFTTIDVGIPTVTFYKIDKQGNLLWGKICNYSGNFQYLRKLPGDRFATVFQEIIGGSNYPVLVDFDKEATPLSQNAYASNQAGIELFAKDLTFLNDGSPAIAGTSGPTPYLFFIKADKAYHSGCDVASPPVSLSTIAATYALINMGKNPRSFTMVNQATTTLPLNPPLLTWCTVPKTLELGNDTAICQGTTIHLKNLSGDVFDSYRWSTGDTTASIHVSNGGLYWLVAKDRCDVAALSDSFRLSIKPAAIAELGSDRMKCEDSLLTLQATWCADCIYTWSTGSHLSSVTIVDPGSYWLRIDNTNGCNSTDTIQINDTKCHCTLFIPNAFTPNQDGLNDGFKPMYHCDIAEYSFRIFNRWGELLYESNDPAEAWNGQYKGQTVKQDIYSYQLGYQPVINGAPQRMIYRSGKVAVVKQ
jgi:gliding motility-associated-like protein